MKREDNTWVDVHNHVIPSEYVGILSDKGVKKALGVRFPDWSAKKTIKVMDRYNVRTAILSVSAPGVYFGKVPQAVEFARVLASQTNDICAKLVNDHPTRFGAFATVPLPDVDSAVMEARRALETLKLDGLVLLSNYDGYYLGDPRFDRLFSELNRRKAVVFVHPATPPGMAESHLGLPEAMMDVCFDTTRTAFSLLVNGVTRKYPEIRFILAHAGGTVPYIAGRVDMLASLFEGIGGAAPIVASGLGLVSSVIPGMRERLPDELDIYLRFKENLKGGPDQYLSRFYYDSALSTSPHVFASLLTLVGSSKILFGSDYPFATESATPATIEGLKSYEGFDPEDLAGIASNNARSLFPRLSEGP